MLLNEALATSLGNGYVYGDLNNKLDTGIWYNRKYINLMAKKIYPLVEKYVMKQKKVDKAFIDSFITIYDNNFSSWLTEMNNLMTDRFVISDNTSDFDIIDNLFAYRSMSQYEHGVSGSSFDLALKSPITKIIILSKENKQNINILKNKISELRDWNPNVLEDFRHSIFLKDKTWLMIINPVQKTVEAHLNLTDYSSYETLF